VLFRSVQGNRINGHLLIIANAIVRQLVDARFVKHSREGVRPKVHLPENLQVAGGLSLRRSTLEGGLFSAGRMALIDCDILGLPHRIDCRVEFNRCRVLLAGAAVDFEGPVVLIGCEQVELGAGVHFSGDLTISYCRPAAGDGVAVRFDPETRCDGEVRISGSMVAFSERFRCGGSLAIERCTLVGTPRHFAVGGDIVFSDCGIDGWPMVISSGRAAVR
jgi:hypothetical protein